MSSALSIFDISRRAMAAQLVRLNTTASNLANAGSVSGSEALAYHTMKPVFRTVMDGQGGATVDVERIANAGANPTKHHDPTHPLADRNGDVWEASVDSAAELVEMIDAARQYQNNVQVMQTAKGLISETLRMGQ